MLSIIEAHHQCLGTEVVKFCSSSSHEWLDEVVSYHFEVTKATNPNAIVDCLWVCFGEEIRRTLLWNMDKDGNLDNEPRLVGIASTWNK